MNFPSGLALGDLVTWYLLMLLVGGGRYSVELVQVCNSWSGHHGYKKNDTMSELAGMELYEN